MANAEFSGNIAHTIDAKGRVTIPAAYREALGNEFTIGLSDNFSAIALYPKQRWDEIGEDLNRIPDSDARGMAYVRLIKAFSFTGQQLDGQGRLLLPANLREKVGLNREICFVGVGRFLEIWDEARFNEFCLQSETDFASLMDYVNDRYFSPSEGAQ